MQNAWLRDLELAWSLRNKKESKLPPNFSSQYGPKPKTKKKKTKKRLDSDASGSSAEVFHDNDANNNDSNANEKGNHDKLIDISAQSTDKFHGMKLSPMEYDYAYPPTGTANNDKKYNGEGSIKKKKETDSDNISTTSSVSPKRLSPDKINKMDKLSDGIEFRRCGVGSP